MSDETQKKLLVNPAIKKLTEDTTSFVNSFLENIRFDGFDDDEPTKYPKKNKKNGSK
jgi:hypothetical protein